MAKLQIISLEEGRPFSPWFNGTNGFPLASGRYFDASDRPDHANTQEHDNSSMNRASAGFWQISKKEIQAGNYTWRGNFKTNGDRIVGGYVTEYERDMGSEHIKLSDFKYPAVGYKTAGAFTTLTLPEAITDHFETAAYIDQYGYEIPIHKAEEIRSLKPGMTYTFETIYDSSNQKNERNTQEDRVDDTITKIYPPTKFNIKKIDKVTNFKPSTDSLEIDTNSFGIDNSATFAAEKNKKLVKKKLAKLDIDFLYDQRRGGLYFNENGADKGFGAGGIIAVLKGAPELTASNLSFT